MTHRRPTRAGTRKPRHERPQPQPTGPRVSVQVAEFPLSRDATAEPPHRSALGRRYDARRDGRKGTARGPQLRVRPAMLVRLAVLAVALLVLLTLTGRL